MAYTDVLTDADQLEDEAYKRLKRDKYTLDAMDEFIKTWICNIEDDDDNLPAKKTKSRSTQYA